MKVDALIVDLDGVIRHWDMTHFEETALALRLTREEFGAIAFAKELLDAGMVGTISFEEWAEEIGRRAAAQHGCDPADVARGFSVLRWSVDWDVVALLREVRAKGAAKLALFSNASTKLEADLASVALDVEFDVIFNSARLGLAKPDPAAFIEVARRLDTPVARCLFVDDTIPNVEGARAAGLQAEVFVDVATLRTQLITAGLVDGAARS